MIYQMVPFLMTSNPDCFKCMPLSDIAISDTVRDRDVITIEY